MSGNVAPGGGAGKLEIRGETSLGASGAAWKNLRPESAPQFDANPVRLTDVSWAGHRHPADCGESLPVGVRLVEPGAVSFQTALYRAASGGDTPTIVKIQMMVEMFFCILTHPFFGSSLANN